jgi:hypothetical protein
MNAQKVSGKLEARGLINDPRIGDITNQKISLIALFELWL